MNGAEKAKIRKMKAAIFEEILQPEMKHESFESTSGALPTIDEVLEKDWVSWDDIYILGYSLVDKKLATDYDVSSEEIRKAYKKDRKIVPIKDIAISCVEADIEKLKLKLSKLKES
jgi:hypothetical protein